MRRCNSKLKTYNLAISTLSEDDAVNKIQEKTSSMFHGLPKISVMSHILPLPEMKTYKYRYL